MDLKLLISIGILILFLIIILIYKLCKNKNSEKVIENIYMKIEDKKINLFGKHFKK